MPRWLQFPFLNQSHKVYPGQYYLFASHSTDWFLLWVVVLTSSCYTLHWAASKPWLKDQYRLLVTGDPLPSMPKWRRLWAGTWDTRYVPTASSETTITYPYDAFNATSFRVISQEMSLSNSKTSYTVIKCKRLFCNLTRLRCEKSCRNVTWVINSVFSVFNITVWQYLTLLINNYYI